MTLFHAPRHRELTSSGAVVPGAKLYFYVAGTSTPATTYQDAALSVEHSNPVLADTGGLLPAIWLDPAVSYDVTCKRASGAVQWTAEDVSGGAGDELVLYSEQTTEPYTNTFVRFREPDGTTKGVIGFTANADNTMSMTSYEDHRLKFRTGAPGDTTSFLDRVFMFGSAAASFLGIQAPAATTTGGCYIKFTTNDYSVTKGVIGYASTTDDDIDIINSISGGHIEFDTTGTGRIRMPLTDGSESAPMLAVTGDPNTGIYSSAADSIDVTAGGTRRLAVGTASTESFNKIVAPDGSQVAPSIVFNGETTRGFYNTGNENGVAYSHDGTSIVALSATGISLKDGVTAPATVAGFAQIYVDAADGDLKIKFGDGFVRVLGADS